MTESISATSSATPAPSGASFWEDLIDIFYQPRAVFARRRTASAWPPFLFVVIALAVLTFALYNATEPAITGDMRRAMAKSMEHNPQMTQEMADRAIDLQQKFGRYFAGPGIAIAVLVVGFFTWILSKLFGAVEGFGSAMLIASYAYMPRVLGSILGGVIALMSDASKMTSMTALSVGPAKFFDPETTSPFVLALLQRLDVMVIWETVLLAIGVAVIGRISRGKAVAFGVTIWVVGGIYLLRQAFVNS